MTNGEVRAKIQQAIRRHEDFIIAKRRKLKMYGHVSRSLGLAKTILLGTVKGGRRQGKQKKRWEDNTREWTGLEFAKFQKAVEKNKEKWRKLLGKSSVVPQRPSRSKDRLADDEEFGRILVLRSDYRKYLRVKLSFRLKIEKNCRLFLEK